MKNFLLSFVFALGIASNVTAELPSWTALADRARWAANAHNVQSWQLIAIPGRPDQKRLELNPSRLLPETDPFHRQLTISLGAFLAVLEDEASLRGAAILWKPLDDGTPGALLTLMETPGVAPKQAVVDALTAPTVKYRTRAFALPPEVRTQQEARSTAIVRVRWLTLSSVVAPAKTWAQKSFDLEMDLPRTRQESIIYTRYGEGARKTFPWGITLVPNFTEDNLFWIETLAALFPQSPEEYGKSAKQLLAEALGPVEQLLVLTSRGNGVRERIETGRVLQRLWQEVRSRGAELLPLSQGLQEFPEMAALYAEAHTRWAEPGETVQMVLALFQPVAGRFLPSPRLAAEHILSEGQPDLQGTRR